MSSTTDMYIENLIIGIQDTIIYFLIIMCFDIKLLDKILELNVIIEILIILPISYVLGIVMDRISKYIFKKIGKYTKGKGFCEETTKGWYCKELIKKDSTIKCKAGCKPYKDEPYGKFKRHKDFTYDKCDKCLLGGPSIMVWKEFDEMEDYRYTMSRKRILRSTSLNLLVSFFPIAYLCVRTNALDIRFQIAVLVLLLIMSVICFIVYKLLVSEYYKKQRDFAYIKLNKVKEKGKSEKQKSKRFKKQKNHA